jgi:hypothetical protein
MTATRFKDRHTLGDLQRQGLIRHLGPGNVAPAQSEAGRRIAPVLRAFAARETRWAYAAAA